jgi:hypothetical protein
MSSYADCGTPHAVALTMTVDYTPPSDEPDMKQAHGGGRET